MRRTDTIIREKSSNNLEANVFLAQELAKISTAVLLVLLAFKGLLAFYDAKQNNWLESTINIITAPFVMPFQGLFTDTRAGEVPVLFSMLCVLFLGVAVYVSAGLISKYSQVVRTHSKKSVLNTQKV